MKFISLIYFGVLVLFTITFFATKVFVAGFEYNDFELEMKRTACYGYCPEYTVKVDSEGRVQYEGINFVGTKGKREYTISSTQVQNIRRALISAEFFSLEDEYFEEVTDLPSTFITLTTPDQTKKVWEYYNAPKKLLNLEKTIDQNTGVIDFISCDEELGFCREP